MDSKKPHEVEFELRYGRRYYERHQRLFRRIQVFLTTLQVLGACTGFAAFTQTNPELALWAGLIISLAMAIELSLKPGTRYAEASYLRKLYADAITQLKPENSEFVADKVKALQAIESDADIEALRKVSYNDVLEEMGYDKDVTCSHEYTLGLTERILKALA